MFPGIRTNKKYYSSFFFNGQLNIQAKPNLSNSVPKRSPQKVSCSGMVMIILFILNINNEVLRKILEAPQVFFEPTLIFQMDT